jgi:hypothetical protein
MAYIPLMSGDQNQDLNPQFQANISDIYFAPLTLHIPSVLTTNFKQSPRDLSQ